MQSKTIYEKQYPKWEIPTEEEIKEMNEVEVEETEHLSFEQIMEKIYKDMIYVLMPERKEKAKAFILKAIAVSELYEMDIKSNIIFRIYQLHIISITVEECSI